MIKLNFLTKNIQTVKLHLLNDVKQANFNNKLWSTESYLRLILIFD